MSSPAKHGETTPLGRNEAHEVLRYWLASVRLEEALAARPRAQRAQHEAGVKLRLDQPIPGQQYFKQPLDEACTELLFARKGLERALNGELSAFFEDWLHTQYRRAGDDNEPSHLLCFPALQLPRGELAGLLRAPLGVRFHAAGGAPFRVPSYRERARGVYPDAPVSVQLSAPPRREAGLPLFLDTRLLQHTLGVGREAIDSLFEQLREQDDVSELRMVQLLTELLEGQAASANEPTNEAGKPLLQRLLVAVRRLLQLQGSRAEAYAVALVIDGSQAKTTWHLQRELVGLLEEDPDLALHTDAPLGAYLRGWPLPEARALQRAQFFGPSLTDSQRGAAELFWGSRFSCVQGPPGTGKTTLILHLCAEALLQRMEPLLEGQAPGEALLVIASSNNRAVDNVLDPLAAGLSDGVCSFALPLGLRAGSRQVVGRVLAEALRGAIAWLAGAQQRPLPERSRALDEAKSHFAQLRSALSALQAPRARRFAAAHEREQLVRELRALAEPCKSEADELDRLAQRQAEALAAACLSLDTRLSILSRLCEATATPVQLRAVASQYARMLKNDLPGFDAALAEAGLDLVLPLPPRITPALTPEELMDAWEEASEQSLSLVAALRARLERRRQRVAGRLAHERIGARLAQLDAEASMEAEDAPLGALPRELFGAALALREAWAALHADELRAALECALRAAEGERTLRPFFRDEPLHAAWLRRLFPVWGSTLLSLGNCFAPEPDELAHVVIDEAGQCHPAHAVSALLRARSALVLGDVHQLTPVFELGREDDQRTIGALRLTIARDRLEPYRVHDRSLSSTQSLAERCVARRHALIDHFRCQPAIIQLSDALCGYGLSVHTRPMSRQDQLPFLHHPLCLVDVRGRQQQTAGSLCNEAEHDLLSALVDTLLRRGVEAHELAVITPYRGQLELLRRSFRARGIPLERSAELEELSAASAGTGVALGTVHRFQGGERSLVLFSSVATERKSLPFLDARPNLLNVAVSRARHHFVCFGDQGLLAQGARTRLLVESAQPLSPSAFLDA